MKVGKSPYFLGKDFASQNREKHNSRSHSRAVINLSHGVSVPGAYERARREERRESDKEGVAAESQFQARGRRKGRGGVVRPCSNLPEGGLNLNLLKDSAPDRSL